MRVGLDELHIWYAVEIDAVMQVGDCQIIFVEIGMCTKLLINLAPKIQEAATYMRVRICFDHFNTHGSTE